jgi:hypothetical protein
MILAGAITVRIAVAMLTGMAVAVLVACPGLDIAHGRAVEPEGHRGQRQAGDHGGQEKRQTMGGSHVIRPCAVERSWDRHAPVLKLLSVEAFPIGRQRRDPRNNPWRSGTANCARSSANKPRIKEDFYPIIMMNRALTKIIW